MRGTERRVKACALSVPRVRCHFSPASLAAAGNRPNALYFAISGALSLRMSSPRTVLLMLLAALIVCAAPAHAQTITGRATVVDGGTLEVRGSRIHLFGIEQAADDHVCVRTDDERWRCGPRALNALEEFLEELIVSCVVKSRDASGQLAASCSASGIDLGLWLVRNGLALASPTASSSRYRQAQDEAKAARRGMWSVPGAVQ
jgi:endonuclease YncB( thermonuclease family)